MSTRIVGIGDIHEHPGPRNTDRLAALDQIISEGRELPNLGAWALAGDLFHAKSTVDGRNALDERLIRMGSVAPIFIDYGNHDERGDLDGFARLKTGFPIYVFDRPHVQVARLATGEMAAVFGLPYPHKAGLVSAGVNAGDVVDTAADMLDPIFMAAAAQLQQARDAGYITFMLAHANIAGAIASTGQPQIGHEIEVSSRHLDRLGPILKLFGHIHKPQEIAGALFIGSICRLDFGEAEEKRYVIATFGKGDEMRQGATDDDGWLFDVESMPIDIAPMFHVEGELTRDGFSWELPGGQEMPHDGAAIDWTGADVRVRYRYRASEKSALRPESITEEFAGALRLKIEGVAIADRELRAPDVAAAKTLPEKLAAYRKQAQLEPSIAAKLALLEQPNVDLLGAVTVAIAAIEQPEKAEVAA